MRESSKNTLTENLHSWNLLLGTLLHSLQEPPQDKAVILHLGAQCHSQTEPAWNNRMAELRASLSSGRGAPHTQGPDSHPQYNREIKDRKSKTEKETRERKGEILGKGGKASRLEAALQSSHC